MKLNEFLVQYFDAYLEELKTEHPNVCEEDLKDIFAFGFIEGYTFNSEIITDLNEKVLEIKNESKQFPVKLKDFFENKW